MSQYIVPSPSLMSIKPATKVSLRDENVCNFEGIFEKVQSQSPSICSSSSLKAVKVLDDVYYIDNILSKQECEELCQEIQSSKHLSFWSEGGRDNKDVKSFRDADTIEVQSTYIADIIWERLQNHLQHINLSCSFENHDDDGKDINWKIDLPGTWTPAQINHDLLFAKYTSLGYFSPHTDGNAIHHFNLRSFYSIILFLNDIPLQQGGGTKFYDTESVLKLYQMIPGISAWKAPDAYCLAEVEAVAGRCLFFHQHYVHEGVSPQTPYEKYILRTDIMFQRTPALLTEPQEEMAYKVHQEAEVLAEAGEVEESIRLFRKAYKMSPALARLMGQA